MNRPAKGFTIIGTDTEIGKTFVSSMVIEFLKTKNYRVGAYKPVASGIDSETTRKSDPARLSSALGDEFPLERICPQQFSASKAPSIAAGLKSLTVDRELLINGLNWWTDNSDVVVVETVGGLMSPIDDGITNADLAVEFGYPCLLIVPNRLGAIHQCLVALGAAERFGLDVLAVILNQTQNENSLNTPREGEIPADIGETVFDEHLHLIDTMRSHPQVGPTIPSHIFHLEHDADFLAVRFTNVIESAL